MSRSSRTALVLLLIAVAVAVVTVTDSTTTNAARAIGPASQPADRRPGAEAPAAPALTRIAAPSGSLSAVPPVDARWVDVLVVTPDGQPQPSVDVHWSIVNHRGRPATSERERGWSTRTNAAGVAHIAGQDHVVVRATQPGRYGELEILDFAQASRHQRLILFPDRTLRALVLDARNAPVPGLDVQLVIRNRAGERFGSNIGGRSGEDGIAKIEHVQYWLDENALEPTLDGVGTAEVALSLVGMRTEGVTFSLTAMPTEPIVIRAPPLGEVRVRSEHADEVALSAVNGTGSDAYATVDDDGYARFLGVALGAKLRASSNHDLMRLQREFRGPIAPGEVVQVELVPEYDRAAMRGRLLDQDGTPVADTPFRLEIYGSNCRSRPFVVTDGEGRFRLAISRRPRPEGAKIRSATLVALTPDASAVALPTGPLTNGIHDVGDLVLKRSDRLLVAGRLLVDSLPWNSTESFQAPLEVVQQVIGLDGEPRYERYPYACSHEYDRDRFRIYCYRPATGLALRTQHEELEPIEPIPFEAGDAAAEVQVTRVPPALRAENRCALRATVLLPRTCLPHLVEASITPERAPTLPIESRANYEGSIERLQGEYCTVQFDDIPPGTYTLELRLPAHQEPLARIENVLAPTNGDPRLHGIRLANTRVVTIRTFDAAGAPLRPAGGLFPVDPRGQDAAVAHPLLDHVTRLLLPVEHRIYHAAVPGHQLTRVAIDGPVVDFRLAPWPTMTLTIDSTIELPEHTKLRGTLIPVEPIAGTWRSADDAGELSDLLQPSESSGSFRDGRLRLPIGHGPHRIELELVYRRRRQTTRSRLNGLELPVVFAAQGQVQLDVTDAIGRARERLGR